MEELQKRGWTGPDLERRRKTDAVKVLMAVRLSMETMIMLDCTTLPDGLSAYGGTLFEKAVIFLQ